MARSFICDANITPKLLNLLRSHGHDAVHVVRMGLSEISDIDIWRYAAEHDAIIVSKDWDFVALNTATPGPRLVFVTLGNCRDRDFLRRFEESLEQILAHFDSGNRLVELTW